MKIRITKHKFTLEDFTQETFNSIDYSTIEARLLHNQYNKFLQYYFIKFIYDAIEASRSTCNCQSRLQDRTILEKCDNLCEQIPNKEKFIKYIEENLLTYRNLLYDKFDEWLEFKRHQCDNECNIFEDISIDTLKYPIMNCLHDNSVILDFLEVNNTEELQEYILKITDYLDYKLEDDQIDTDIEALKFFNYIKQFNELKISQWPKKIYLNGFRFNYDGAEGEFYLQDEKTQQDYGIINNFKGLCYKRYYQDEVNANWFGIKYYEDHSDIFLYLLRNDKVNLNDSTYNIKVTAVAQRPINNSIWWYGYGATLNITLENEVTSILQFILLKDIYQIKIEGLSIIIDTDKDIPFIEMNDDFKVDIFLFDSTLQSKLGVEANEFIDLNKESIKSDIFWSTLPLIPTIKDTENENQLLNLEYINQIKETTIDSVLTIDTIQNIEVIYNLENSFKIVEPSEYGNNKMPLCKKYLNNEYFHSIAEKYIEPMKKVIVNQMDITIPDGMIYASTVDNGFLNENINSSEPWDVAGSGSVNQDFNKLLHLPHYIDNLKFIKNINIFNSSIRIPGEKYNKKKLLTRFWQYDSNNPIEPETLAYNDERGKQELYLPISNTIDSKGNAFYRPINKKYFKFEPDDYYLIYVRCNTTYDLRYGYEVYLDFRWDSSQYSMERILYDLISAPRNSWNANMYLYRMNFVAPKTIVNVSSNTNVVTPAGFSVAFNFNLIIGQNKETYDNENSVNVIDFKRLWQEPTAKFFTENQGTYNRFRVGLYAIAYVKKSNLIDLGYLDNLYSIESPTTTITSYVFEFVIQQAVITGYRLTDPSVLINKMRELIKNQNTTQVSLTLTFYRYYENSNINLQCKLQLLDTEPQEVLKNEIQTPHITFIKMQNTLYLNKNYIY